MREIYKTIIVPLKCNDIDFEYLKELNKVSANVWNYCVKIDKEYKESIGKSMGLSLLESSTKQKFPIHAKGIHHIVFKYYYARAAMWNSRKAKHSNSYKVELPHKEKKYLPTGWDNQAIFPNYKKRIIKLTTTKGRKQVICHVKSMPKNIVEIELVYKDKYYLSIKYKEENNINLIQSDNVASIDLGEIHAIVGIDNNKNAIIITNRKVRSLIRLKDKRQGELKSLQSRCVKYSKKYKKYAKAIWKIKFEFDRKINDAIHKQTKSYIDYCLRNNINKVFYGDLDTTTRGSKGKLNNNINHKLNMWRFGQIMLQLENKLSRYGIKLLKVKEYYTSQKCPCCGEIKKQSNRNYMCDKCGYTQHRDIVGSMNILNDNTEYHVEKYDSKVYLQIC